METIPASMSMPKGYLASETSIHFMDYVWCPKYRRKPMIGAVESRLKEPIHSKAVLAAVDSSDDRHYGKDWEVEEGLLLHPRLRSRRGREEGYNVHGPRLDDHALTVGRLRA